MRMNIADQAIMRGYFCKTIIRGDENEGHRSTLLSSLLASCGQLDLESPLSAPQLEQLFFTISALAKDERCEVEILVTGGPGRMGIVIDSSSAWVFAICRLVREEILPQAKRLRIVDSSLLLVQDTVKSTNYVTNSYIATQAKKRGGYIGIFTDEDGCLLEAAMANVAVLF